MHFDNESFQHLQTGLNFYMENEKTGRLEALATELHMGEGKDITLPPGRSLTIKAMSDYVYI